jgi:hypothetical protein
VKNIAWGGERRMTVVQGQAFRGGRQEDMCKSDCYQVIELSNEEEGVGGLGGCGEEDAIVRE